ncbi:MAG: translocation/assembly module TamB domain-containing protein, partial [Hyphococcus sp.]
MRRILIISLLAIGALAAGGLLATAWLFNTDSGRAFVIARAEPILSDALGARVAVERLEGAPPTHLILRNASLADEAGVWLHVETISLRWRPLRLLTGGVYIDEAVIENARLLREPPSGDGGEDDEPFELKLPDDLPDVIIDNATLANFRSELGGVSSRLDGAARIAMGGAAVNARLNLTSEGDADIADVAVDLSPDAERLFIDATIAAQPGGVIAAFTGLDTTFFLNARGDSPTDAALIEVSSVIGDYGMAEAMIAGDLTDLTAIDVEGRFIPGAALTSIDELAAPVAFNARVRETPDGGALQINALRSALGDISGEIQWRLKGDRIAAARADLTAALNPDYRSEIQAYTGAAITAEVGIEQERGQYGLALALRSDNAALTIADGMTDLDRVLSGALRASLKPSDGAPFPPSDISLVSQLYLDTEEEVRFDDFTLAFADGSSAAGDAAFTFADEALSAAGDIEATPALVSAFASTVAPQGSIRGAFEIEGPLERFTARADFDTPRIAIGDSAAPPLRINAAFAGLPELPTGDLRASAKEGAGEFTLSMRSSQDGTIAVPSLLYTGSGFELSGEGRVNPQTRAATLDLAYAGETGAEPWPGLDLTGDMLINANYSQENAQASFAVAATRLSARDILVSDLSLTGAGDPAQVAVSLSAAALTLPDIGGIASLKASADVGLAETTTIGLNDLSGLFSGIAFSLPEPAVIDIDDGAAVRNFRMRWGDAGRIALDGDFSSRRWRADIEMTDVNIPEADGRVTLNARIDTDAPTPGRADFRLRSLLTRAPSAAISGSAVWDGRQVVIASADDDAALDMRLTLPASLRKAPTLQVDADGPLEGFARYQGRIDVLAAYLPPELQTFEGDLDVNMTLAGTLSDPLVDGQATLRNGAYTEFQSGLSLAGLHVEADAAYSGDSSIVRFTGGARGAEQPEGDTILLSGEITLDDAPAADLAVRLDNAVLSALPVSSVRANGVINIAGPLDAIEASGAIEIEELNAEIITPESTGLVPIEVIAYNSETSDSVTVAEDPSSPIGYDLTVKADDRLFVRGRGLESEWAADVKIVDAREQPLITGAMTLRRGWLDFSGRRFDLTRGVITFDRLAPNNPLLDIRAEFETGDGVTAAIVVSGRAEKPSIELTSTPSLPSEDVMALVLFGKPAGELTALESLQTAQALASLGGVGPFGGGGGGITGSIREAVGLDLLNIDIDPENGGGSLTVGKYVADGFFVSATQDAQGESGAVRVEYEITNNISVETEIRQDGDQT